MEKTQMKYKQFVIVPRKPKMSKGKIASQVVHATFMALEKQTEMFEEFMIDSDNIDEWKETGMCVIVLECKNEVQLMGIAKYLDQWNVPNHLYIDEGMTEVEMGTATALATGVLDDQRYGWMFKQLCLFDKFN